MESFGNLRSLLHSHEHINQDNIEEFLNIIHVLYGEIHDHNVFMQSIGSYLKDNLKWSDDCIKMTYDQWAYCERLVKVPGINLLIDQSFLTGRGGKGLSFKNVNVLKTCKKFDHRRALGDNNFHDVGALYADWTTIKSLVDTYDPDSSGIFIPRLIADFRDCEDMFEMRNHNHDYGLPFLSPHSKSVLISHDLDIALFAYKQLPVYCSTMILIVDQYINLNKIDISIQEEDIFLSGVASEDITNSYMFNLIKGLT